MRRLPKGFRILNPFGNRLTLMVHSLESVYTFKLGRIKRIQGLGPFASFLFNFYFLV
jgi:hypothetical protein